MKDVALNLGREFRRGMVAEPSQRPDFVLESSVCGSKTCELIHGTDVPTLELLIKVIANTHQLGDTKVVGVALKIGNRVCELNMREPRDWEYISKLVTENGGRAEMVVEV